MRSPASVAVARRNRNAGPGDVLVKAACSKLLRKTTPSRDHPIFQESAVEVAQRIYGGDPDVQNFITRAVAPPAISTVPGNAAELVATTTLDFLTGADTPSAFAQLAQRVLTVAAAGSVKIPARAHPLVLAGGWVGEGLPKPVHADLPVAVDHDGTKQVGRPHHIRRGTRAVFDADGRARDARQPAARSRRIVRHRVARCQCGDKSEGRPVCLRTVSVTASAASPLTDAMLADLGALVAAVDSGQPGARPVIIANSKQGLRL